MFNNPNGVAVDSAGNVYVADTYNDTIRKITSAGVVSTLAGSAGISGSTDLTGINALFNQPGGVAVDGAGNVYVADTANGTIRAIAPSGAVTTVAGTAGIAGLGNTAGSVLFNQPRALLVDGSGNIFVADTGNADIRKIAPDHSVTTMSLSAASTGGGGGGTPPPPPPTMSGGGSSGGGGGAMPVWFVAALALLGAGRLTARGRPTRRQFGSCRSVALHNAAVAASPARRASCSPSARVRRASSSRPRLAYTWPRNSEARGSAGWRRWNVSS